MRPVGGGHGATAIAVATAWRTERSLAGVGGARIGGRRVLAVMRAHAAAALGDGRSCDRLRERQDVAGKREQQEKSCGQAMHASEEMRNPVPAAYNRAAGGLKL